MSIPIRRAIYGKLAGDTTLDNLLATPPSGWTHNIFHNYAPGEAEYPLVIFQQQADRPEYALGDKAFDNEFWTIKGVDRNDYGDADPVDAIQARLDELLTDQQLSIAGGAQVLYLRKMSGIQYPETIGDMRVLHSGALYRLAYE